MSCSEGEEGRKERRKEGKKERKRKCYNEKKIEDRYVGAK